MHFELRANAGRQARSAFFSALGATCCWLAWMVTAGAQAQTRVVDPSQKSLSQKSLSQNNVGSSGKSKKADQQQIKLWISQLADPSFLVRKHAKSELVRAGAAAYDQLFRAQGIDDLEARLTINELLSLIQIHWIQPGDSPVVVDLMLDFQLRPIPERLAVIDRLSWLSSRDSWQSIYQIVIYDKSPTVSDYAAARLMEMVFLRDAGPTDRLASGFAERQSERFRSLQHLLKSDSRWGEKLIAICFAIATKEDRIVNQSDWVESALQLQQGEIAGTENAPDQLRYIESRLIANRVLYQRLSKQASSSTNDVATKLQRLDQISIALALPAEDISVTHLLLDSLLENRRYGNAQKLASQFTPVIQQDALAGVMVAECFRQNQQLEQGQRLASQSFSRVPADAGELELFVQELRDRGLNDWASQLLLDRQARGQLPDKLMLLSAEVELALGRTKQAKQVVQRVIGQSPVDALQFRGHLLLAKAASLMNDSTTELHHLESALKLEPLSVSTLVRMGHLSEKLDGFDLASFRQKVEIAQGAYLDQLRRGTELMNSDLPAEENLGRVRTGRAAYSLAWLLSQLDLDLDEAQKMAKTAVKLEPRNPQYLDALAFCEFRRGNRDLAVLIQRRAIFAAGDNAEFRARLQKYLNER